MHDKPQDDLFSWFCFSQKDFINTRKTKQFNELSGTEQKAQQSDGNVQLKVAYY